MKVVIHPHAEDRMKERGITSREIEETIERGESFGAKFGREGFRRNFSFEGMWRGRTFATKQVEVIALWEKDSYIVITARAKYY